MKPKQCRSCSHPASQYSEKCPRCGDPDPTGIEEKKEQEIRKSCYEITNLLEKMLDYTRKTRPVNKDVDSAIISIDSAIKEGLNLTEMRERGLMDATKTHRVVPEEILDDLYELRYLQDALFCTIGATTRAESRCRSLEYKYNQLRTANDQLEAKNNQLEASLQGAFGMIDLLKEES